MTIKEAVLGANVLEEGHFVFADGHHALQKLEMDNLWERPDSLAVVVNQLSAAKGLPEADIIVGVPTGGQRLAEAVSRQTGLPLVRLERVPGGKKQDFRFATTKDAEAAARAKSVRIYEDVVTTLSSIAGVVKLFDAKNQQLHSLAIWRRGKVTPAYRDGVTDHYLVEDEMPSFSPEQCPVDGRVES